jgi:hypothetical protein
MIDYVYICRDGDNEELRYSIRSVEKNFPKGRIWVVGGRPSWYTGNYIPVKNYSGKQQSALENLKKITESKEIKETFVLMNDDFFVVKPVKSIKVYHGGDLEDKIYLRRQLTPGAKYPELLSRTYKALKKRKVDKILDYDIHVPMPMSKTGLKKALDIGTQWRSTYGNLYQIGGKEMRDVKVYHSGNMLEVSYDINNLTSEYLSTDDSSFPRVWKELLRDMFPHPSSCELDYAKQPAF